MWRPESKRLVVLVMWRKQVRKEWGKTKGLQIETKKKINKK